MWKFKTLGSGYFPNGSIQKGILFDNGKLYFGSRDYNLYVLNAEDGRSLWNFREPRGWIISTPVSDSENVYFGSSDGHAYFALNKKESTLKWRKELNMRAYGSGILWNNKVYFGTFDGKLYGLNKLSGDTEFLFQTENSKKNYNLVFDINGQFKSDFELYGPNTLKSENLIHSLGSILCTPWISDGIIYFVGSNNQVCAVRL